MTGIEFVVVWVGWVLAGASPGPATMGIAATAMSIGRASALAFACGVLAGSATWGIAAALGLSAIMLANAWLFELVRLVGALYLGWLAIKALRSALRPGPAAAVAPFRGRPAQVFAKGAAIHLTNPKAILGWGAIYAIVAPAGATPTTLLALFGVLYAGSVLVFIGYALLFSTLRMAVVYGRLRRWFDAGFAGFFGLASVSVLTARLP